MSDSKSSNKKDIHMLLHTIWSKTQGLVIDNYFRKPQGVTTDIYLNLLFSR